MRKILIGILQKRAVKIVSRFNPKVVAVTGSMGKTSARNAIALVLASRFKVRTAKKNFNNEIGVPLTVLGTDSPGRNIFKWIKIFWHSFFIKEFPEILVLEYGADRPGDIDFLCRLITPNVSVLTGISSVHAQFFDNIDHLAAEKARIIKHLPKDGTAVLNADDERVVKMQSMASASIKYGTCGSCDLCAENISLATRFDDNYEVGEIFVKTTADITLKGKTIGELELNNAVGYTPVMASLAALAVGEVFGVSFTAGLTALNQAFRPEAGRLNPLPGIKGSLIIDDSYNAAPASMMNGLNALRSFAIKNQNGRRIAVLGSMAELGVYNEEEHKKVGRKAAEVADILIFVGENMKIAARSAEESGFLPENIHWFDSSVEAGRFLDRDLRTGDIVYVKGSQSMRMEKVVKDIMAEPEKAAELLVRQDKKWLKT
ncbi:hypothetical protein D6827_00545 [Candidatus Parcubacteria bacterium]|nr:MAG: hypothetical protein D6827_00545 [Candidatus Parcubacteria bacterium]